MLDQIPTVCTPQMPAVESLEFSQALKHLHVYYYYYYYYCPWSLVHAAIGNLFQCEISPASFRVSAHARHRQPSTILLANGYR